MASLLYAVEAEKSNGHASLAYSLITWERRKINDFELGSRRGSCMVTGLRWPRHESGDKLAGKLPYFVTEKSAQIRFVRSSSLGPLRANVP
jgi:hypothetical protein